MNKEWSELNKQMQALIAKPATFSEGIAALMTLRDELFAQALQYRRELSEADFSAMPYPRADGYHSKTAAYSLWHIFRIEDITAHTLIAGDDEVLFSGGFVQKTHAPIITTGNELVGEEIAEFSRALDIDGLYEYITAVKRSTEELLRTLTFERTKQRVTPERRQALEAGASVSRDERAWWLVDYWCGKDVRGLIKMPFSRHWIMHIEACGRIIKGIERRG